jgi:hypothetical protein
MAPPSLYLVISLLVHQISYVNINYQIIIIFMALQFSVNNTCNSIFLYEDGT